MHHVSDSKIINGLYFDNSFSRAMTVIFFIIRRSKENTFLPFTSLAFYQLVAQATPNRTAVLENNKLQRLFKKSIHAFSIWWFILLH